MATTDEKCADGSRFGNRALLDKFDKLRELGVSADTPLPQIVVAGEQSAGKSSVLESLTGISFPRAVKLCTRFATEIICRREKESSVVVKIQPGAGCSPAHADEVRKFCRTVTKFTGDAFAEVFNEAKPMTRKEDTGAPTFSRDVLRIEKNGLNEENLTLIDVPGIFENESPGLTTKSDIEMVKDMVTSYIKESRTIILAVVPCNVDIATQKIIRLALEVDPRGQRTLGVLTKPDLAIENATKAAVVELINGSRRDLSLGYCVVRNRGADDKGSSIKEHDAQERNFFAEKPWSELDQTRVGISALRTWLGRLLADRSKSEYPNVKREIEQSLKTAKKQLEEMGPARGEPDEQRAYLGTVAGRFAQLMKFGLDAYYTGDPIFIKKPDLRLITRVREMNEAFSEMFFSKAHSMSFSGTALAASLGVEKAKAEQVLSKVEQNTTPELLSTPSTSATPSTAEPTKEVKRNDLYDLTFTIPDTGKEELDDILADAYFCDNPDCENCLISDIRGIYRSSRGYELGTFGSDTIPTTFRLQAEKWHDATLAHVSNVMLVVHHFITGLIEESCPDERTREELWSFLLDELTPCYKRAMDRARFLLKVELEGKAVTCNPGFNRDLKELEIGRKREAYKDMASPLPGSNDDPEYVPRELYVRLDKLLADSDAEAPARGAGAGADEMCAKIHDVMKSYYEVARSRFVDNVVVQAVDHHLLSGDSSPLKVFGPERVLSMTADQLDMIAGEDAAGKERRIQLKQRIARLEEAKKVLRG